MRALTMAVLVWILASTVLAQENTKNFETAHWKISGPRYERDINRWTITSKNQDVLVLIEAFRHYDGLAILIQQRREDGCIRFQTLAIRTKDGGYEKEKSVRADSWTDLCKNPPYETKARAHPDLIGPVSRFFGEFPQEVLRDIRPYLAALGFKI